MPETHNLILHICTKEAWQEAQTGMEYCPPSLEEFGFIHFSRPEQVLDVANALFRGKTNLLLLWVDPQKVEAEIRWEASGGEQFPHLYGPLNLEAVLAVQDFVPDGDGIFKDLV